MLAAEQGRVRVRDWLRGGREIAGHVRLGAGFGLEGIWLTVRCCHVQRSLPCKGMHPFILPCKGRWRTDAAEGLTRSPCFERKEPSSKP